MGLACVAHAHTVFIEILFTRPGGLKNSSVRQACKDKCHLPIYLSIFVFTNQLLSIYLSLDYKELSNFKRKRILMHSTYNMDDSKDVMLNDRFLPPKNKSPMISPVGDKHLQKSNPRK